MADRSRLHRWFGRTTSRRRILGWILLPVAVTLVLSWLAARTILLDQVDARIDRELHGEAAELRLLAAEGVDPATGRQFADARTLLRLYLDHSLPDDNETMFAIVDGVVDARSADLPPARIDQDAGFVAEAGGATGVRIADLQTGAGLVRTIAVPVRSTGAEPDGVLVVAIFADAEAAAVGATMHALLVAWVGALVVASIVGWFVAGRVLAPVRRVAATARVIEESDLTRRIPVSGAGSGDEIDDVARAVNAMLDRVAAGAEAQRAFVDDAGHELLTPLTIARGYAELMDTPQEAEQARAVVLDELARMTRIVVDMQTLTSATSPGFVRLEPVRVDAVLDEVLVKANGLADRAWHSGGSVDATIALDRQRIVQAMLQLAKNAAAQTDPGAQITIGVRSAPAAVALYVQDTGPGVPAAERARILERFARAPGARGDGAGLGLAIVVAIARAHRGRVRVGEAPGGGAEFEIILPTGIGPAHTEVP